MASPAPESPIDQALTFAERGEHETALRYAASLLEADAKSALRLLVTGWMLGALGDAENAKRGLEVAVERAVDSGSLPLSVAAACKLRDFGGDQQASLALIAGAFSKGSPRLLDKRGAPPNLPGVGPNFTPLHESLEGEELLKKAAAILTQAVQAFKDDRAANPAPKVPPQNLFSALDEQGLLAMIEIFDVRVVSRGTTLVEEGSVGDEAFFVARGELDVQKAGKGGAAPIGLARLGNGALFGEMALLSRAPRTATVIAAVPSVVLVANKTDLDRVVGKVPSVGREFAEYCRRRMLENLLRTNFILRAASPAERPALVERFTIRTFEPGDKIVTQGSPAEGLHLIALGEVEIVHQDKGDRVVVAALGPGEVVGEVALVLRRPAITDVVAHHPTVTLFLPRERLMDLVKAHPKVFVDLYELAVKRDEETSSIAAEEAAETDDFVIV
ncbi:MAG TPA: cyclic nucleotide-binding domain-containing protein [Polyangiaceae bacterium]|jgi:cAMP-dependent protein kinase regulator|nr:cyclic nucleotide-binding domain-containing protein [Polyangiaceae bacterium]